MCSTFCLHWGSSKLTAVHFYLSVVPLVTLQCVCASLAACLWNGYGCIEIWNANPNLFPMYHCWILSNSRLPSFVSATVVLCHLMCLLTTPKSTPTPVSTLWKTATALLLSWKLYACRLRLLHCVALCVGQCWTCWWSLCLYVAMITDLYMDRATFRVRSLASVRRWADFIESYAFIVYLCWRMCTQLDLGQTWVSGSMWKGNTCQCMCLQWDGIPCVVSTWMNLHCFCCVLPSRERTWRVGSRTCLRHLRTVTSAASWLSLRLLKFHFV